MRIGLIDVRYKFNSKKIAKFKFIKEVAPSSDNHWIIENYKSVGRNRNLQFAIMEEQPSKNYGFFDTDTHEFTALEHYSKDGRHFHFEKTGFLLTDNTYFTGHSDAGSIQIAEYTNGQPEYRGTISFYPAVFSFEQYNDLLTDLYAISQNLITNADRRVKVTTIENNKSITLLENIENLENSLRMINEHPFTQLSPILALKAENTHNKFDLRFELNRLKNPGRQHHFGSEMTETNTTVENQLIKQMLEDLLLYSRAQIKKLEHSSASENYQLLSKNKHSMLAGEELKVDSNEIEEVRQYLINQNSHIMDDAHEVFWVSYIDKSKLIQYIDVEKRELVSDNFVLTLRSDKLDRPLRIYNNIFNTFNKDISSHYGLLKLKKGDYIKAKYTKNEKNHINITKINLNFYNKNEYDKWLKDLTPIYTNQPRDEKKHKEFYERKQLTLLSQQNEQEDELVIKYRQMIDLIKRGLQLDIFQNIETHHRLPLTPTATFLNHPFYNMAWRALTNIEKEVELNFIYTLPYENQSFEVGFVRDIYERWLYFKMIELLMSEMGWSLEEDSSILKRKIHEVFEFQREDEAVNLEIRLHFNHQIKLSVHYEPKIMMKNYGRYNHYKPDYVFVFETRLGEKKVAIMDSKFRDYKNQRSRREKKPELRDIAEVPIYQYDYNMLNNIRGDWEFLAQENTIIATGIFHPDTKLETLFPFNVYNKFYNFEQMEEINEELNHVINRRAGQNSEQTRIAIKDQIPTNKQRYSSIPFAPHHTKYFKNWFRMLMEYHLKEYEICWSCGSFNTDDEIVIEKETHFTTIPFTKDYYHCSNCHEFWVKTHCQKKHNNHDLIKHSYNYLKETSEHHWHVQCPICTGVKGNDDDEYGEEE